MFLEIKAILTVISLIFICIVISQILFASLILSFLLFVGMGLYVFGDLLIGYLITKNDLVPQMDNAPQGMETMVLLTLTQRLRIINTRKGPEGKREFVFNREPASVINKGDYQIRLANGNSAFLAHELCDENIHPRELKYAEKIAKEFGTTDIREIHTRIVKKQEKEIDG